MGIVIVCSLCLIGGLCAAPFTLDIQGREFLRLWARYLWFRRNITGCLRDRLRRVLESRDYLGTIKAYAPVFRKPLELERFRLRLIFSTGDAAETAACYGFLCLFFSSLYPLPLRGKPEITLAPRFSSRWEAALDCDISLTIPAAVFVFRMISLSVREKRRLHV